MITYAKMSGQATETCTKCDIFMAEGMTLIIRTVYLQTEKGVVRWC